jgi:BNR/Asp-box repeat
VTRILVGASDGLHVFEDGRSVDVQRIGWDGDSQSAVTALAREGTEVWAVLDRNQIWRTSPDGWSQVVSQLNLDVECLGDTVAGVIVGTSQAHLFRVVPPTPLETVTGFDEVAGRDEWYTPWGGPPATRSISEDDDAVYVNVHVGGIVRTRDGGETWEPTIDIDADVHKVWAGQPGVFAACALGLAVSRDGGETWSIDDEGLHSTYCRGVTVCGDTVLVSASNGPRGGRAAVYRRAVGGGPLERCRMGLPEWFDGNIDSTWLDATPELASFGTSDGRVFTSTDEGMTWEEVAAGLPSIGALLVLPERDR